MVRTSPSLSGVRGVHPSTWRALAMSGWRWRGSSAGGSRSWSAIPTSITISREQPAPSTSAIPPSFQRRRGGLHQADDGSPGRCHYDDARRDLRRAPSGNVSGYTPIKKQSDIRFATSFPGLSRRGSSASPKARRSSWAGQEGRPDLAERNATDPVVRHGTAMMISGAGTTARIRTRTIASRGR
jgi:hypothetical protein